MASDSKAPSYLEQKAASWVSQIVLIGCIIITIGLIYITKEFREIAVGWSVNEIIETR